MTTCEADWLRRVAWATVQAEQKALPKPGKTRKTG